ncbi:MAG TPA: ABC transporter permease, partial [Bryobacteraceae bacterium]|nr:ABC transporter permease [Bryobacteraceae bacterium]
SFRNLITLDPGFRTHGILIATFDLSRISLPAPQIKPAVASLLEEIRAVPQVEAAAATTNIIVNGGSWTLGLTGSLQGNSKLTWVSPGYFDTVEIPILAGRDFTRADVENGQKVAIVNQTFVRRYFPGTNPIGKTFRSAKEPGYPEAEYQIVGICKDTRYSDLRDTPPPQTYAPISQHPSYGPWAAFYIRSAAPLNLLADEIKRRINRSRPGVGTEFRVFQDEVRDSLQRERLLASLSGFFGALAAVLAAIGLYGVIAYIAVRRRNEIGIRMALGATRAGIVGLFLREAALLAAVGAIFGLAGALLFARAARSLLFGFSAYDPLTYGAAAALLAAVVALGSYLPARRAAGLDPLTALHYE